ncbi:CRTAC1 family protein [Cytobacillus oceanisediminis]|uniref:CRTAC1 family protein n=1 Tax=Cytobacillus oceanisediminis TaxID=665099 RepID=UPI001C227728|nr:CRTAC1 family protein [Cytobacillus oceanisediminis]MBU8772032.1 CRTAC1 family protein [Cytobacillus oceanisediminis]
MKSFSKLFIISLMLLLSACDSQTTKTKVDHGFTFEELSKQDTGINFVHEKPTFDSKVNNVMPWLTSTGAGVAVSDYNRDGLMDLYFVNSKENSLNRLYRNNGDGTFTDVAKEAGLAEVNKNGISETAVWLDYDNDGYADLFVGAWGQSSLFKNNGDGTFTDVTEKANINIWAYVSKAITLDFNKDGHLDLYLGAYFDEKDNLWDLKDTKIFHNDFEKAKNGGVNYLLKNNGDGTFTDVASEMKVDDKGWTLATGSADLNGDGWPDIYNANDFGPDSLYLNKEGKDFEKIVQKRGIGDDTFKGMNVDFGDVFHTGKFANYVSNISKEKYLLEGNQMWIAEDGETYKDVAPDLGIKQAGWSWGARFFDADNNGDLDLAVTNGFISADKDSTYWFDMGTLATTPGFIVQDAKNWPNFKNKSMSGYETKSLFLYKNNKFEDVAKDVGITFKDDGRGVAVVDLDNNGTLDLVYANQGAKARVYRNEQSSGSKWIKLTLEGSGSSNRDAIGSKVTITNKGIKTVIEKDGGNSHGAQSDPRIHLGLKDSKQAEEIQIIWPSGQVDTFKNVEANKSYYLKEGAGKLTEVNQEVLQIHGKK